MDKMQAIITKIRDLEIEFQKSQGLILTEEDLQCNVFRKIYDLFYHDLDTMDSGVRGSQLHSELKFFDDQDKLSIVPDITILDTARLSILHSVNTEVTTEGIKYEKYRTKQFEFGGNVTVIELKFCRSKGGITNRDISRYKSDLSKMKNLAEVMSKRSEGVNTLSGLFVVFNRTDIKVAEFEEFMKLDSEKVKIVYATGKLKIEGDSEEAKDSFKNVKFIFGGVLLAFCIPVWNQYLTWLFKGTSNDQLGLTVVISVAIVLLIFSTLIIASLLHTAYSDHYNKESTKFKNIAKHLKKLNLNLKLKYKK